MCWLFLSKRKGYFPHSLQLASIRYTGEWLIGLERRPPLPHYHIQLCSEDRLARVARPYLSLILPIMLDRCLGLWISLSTLFYNLFLIFACNLLHLDRFCWASSSWSSAKKRGDLWSNLFRFLYSILAYSIPLHNCFQNCIAWWLNLRLNW